MFLFEKIDRFSRLNFIFFGLIFIFSKIIFLIGGHLNFPITITIFILSLICVNLVIQFKKDTIKLNILAILLIIFLILISQLYIDLTFDGQSYHQEMIIQLTKGLNPVFEVIDKANVQSVWVNHYPKGYEIIAANFYGLTKRITSVKFINLMFLFLSFLYPFIYFKKEKTIGVAFILALIIAFNPVTLAQLMTNLIDGFLYRSTSIVFFSYLLTKTDKTFFFDFIIGILLLFNVKFTGLIFGFFLVGTLFSYSLVQYKLSHIKIDFKKVIFMILISVPFLFSPYIKNTVDKGHPFYPLMGDNKIDFVDYYVPDVLKDRGKISKLILSNFSSIGNRADTYIKIPFYFTLNELQKMRSGAPHAGSFGVWWGGIVLLTFIYYLWQVFKMTRKFKFSIFELIIALVILLMLMNKAGWWLRYTPYFWLTPLLLILSLMRYNQHMKFLKLFFYLVIFNGLFVLTVSLGLRYQDSMRFKKELISLSKSQKPIPIDFNAYLGNKSLFKEYKINYIESDSKYFVAPKKINDAVVIETKGFKFHEK